MATWSHVATLLALCAASLAANATCSSLDAEVIRDSVVTLQHGGPASRLSAPANATASPGSAFSPQPLMWWPSRQAKPRAQMLAEVAEENDWKNDMVMWMLPESVQQRMPRIIKSWVRCYIMAMALYMSVGLAWAYYIYYAFGKQLFAEGHIPALPDMMEQIKVSSLAMPMYSALPAFVEWVIEQGWTKAFSRVSDVGLAAYFGYFVLYMTSVEFGVYWMHRLLHDIRPGYTYLHYVHHIYNKEHTLSPFAGLAFHPIDGILQAIPYFWTLFLVPAHALTFELLLFATAVWTTNIHDCLNGKMEPIMGAAYHTIHHTTYKHNYGHYFIYMDKIFGTLTPPENHAPQKKAQ